ncbi:protein CURVATURE THYLAKOID 1B, chloroplastic-like [Juglans regia]|uniref:Protein CURVATURE THYLAKOID 1B, chloroplastic-like n=1 Tax=Juglans regia TaxID=51240 RepID=A0A6P9EIT6_JUGRE|nr:protein CURVATURE THYLAKOID 1B, chloroplastic-like [Juglans regia]
MRGTRCEGSDEVVTRWLGVADESSFVSEATGVGSGLRAVGRKIARNVMAMATGEAPAEVAAYELPEMVRTAQEAWDKVEDKYAVSSLAVAGAVGLWVSTGMVSAIDRLPLIPGVLELVGIGYTGWFAYKNLVFKPDR